MEEKEMKAWERGVEIPNLPWRQISVAGTIADSTGENIAIGFTHNFESREEERRALRVMAAAPELMGALKFALETLQSISRDDRSSNKAMARIARDAAILALTKAVEG